MEILVLFNQVKMCNFINYNQIGPIGEKINYFTSHTS